MFRQSHMLPASLLVICSSMITASQNISLKADSSRRAEKALALINKGNKNHIDTKHQNQSDWYLEARDLLQPGDDRTVQAQALIGLGDTGYTDSFYKESHAWYLEARELLFGTQDRVFMIQALIGLAHAGYTDTRHPLPCLWLFEALDLAGDRSPSLRSKILLALKEQPISIEADVRLAVSNQAAAESTLVN